jgi:hypothetical protein
MNERTIFLEAIEIDDADKQAAYVAQACGDNEELHQRVDALLRSHEQAGSFLKNDRPAVADTVDSPSSLEGPGAIIGPYKLLQEIGEGGFGVVFMAKQEKSIKHRVALKIIKTGMDSKQVVARFEAERQALAIMDHPNIARVLDAGTTESGRPYLAMEIGSGYRVSGHHGPKSRGGLNRPNR